MDKVRVSDVGVEKKSAFDILEEYISKAQIIEQNKASLESEVLTSVMEPKVIQLSKLMDTMFNTPEIEDELDIEVELEDEKTTSSNVLEFSENAQAFEELDSSSVKDIEALAENVLEKSEELIQSILDNPEGAVAAQVSSLEDEVDMAFDQLLSESPDEDELDISSFISAKISESKEISETSEDEEAELAAALDQAFAKLNLDGEVEEKAEELDIDINFLKNTFAEEESSSETDS